MNNRSIFVREARPEGSQPTAYVDDMDKFVNTAQIHEQLNFKVGEKEFSLVREF